MRLRLLLLLALAAAIPSAALAQSCCSPSITPSGVIAHPAMAGGKLQLGLFAQHLALAGGRRGTESIPYPNARESDAQTLGLSARYGITSRLTAAAFVPYVWRERSDLAPTGERIARQSRGIGDVAVLGYWRVLPPLRPSEWTLGAGVKLATGESRAADETGELPQELQPGTGANDFLFTTHFARGLGRFTAAGGLTWRLTGTLTKVDVFPDSVREVSRDYRFGNELLYGVSGAWTPDFRFGFELGVRGRHAEPDRETSLRPDGTTGAVETLPSTGGEWIWLAPAVRFATPAGGVTASLVGLLPIYENLLGTQLSTEPGAQLTLEVTF